MVTSAPSRRGVLRGLACCAAAPAAVSAAAAGAQEASASHPAPPGLTSAEALDLLRTGNAAFHTDAPCRQGADRRRRLEIAGGQNPFCVLIGCSDSRVSPELLFGRGLGELFIIRVAGNTVGLAALGSVEYAVAEFGVPLIVVLGHERCGAVRAAVEVVERNATFPGRIGDMVEPIIPAVLQARSEPGDLLSNAVRRNVARVAGGLIQSSAIIEERVADGRLQVVGANYALENGVVEFFEV